MILSFLGSIKSFLLVSRFLPVFLLCMVVLVILSGCMPWGRGTYQVEIFSEMHYNQSYKSQEPPRLYPAVGSVPFLPVGQTEWILHVDQSVTLESNNETVSSGEKLYSVNCLVCHGTMGKGDGPAKDYLIKHGGLPPADVTGPATAMASDAELKGFISLGGRIAYFVGENRWDSPSAMPVFGKLLTDEEQWQLVHYLRTIQSK